MAIGGGLSLADRRLRVGAPARRTVPAGARADGPPRQMLLAAPLGAAALGGGAFWFMLRGMSARHVRPARRAQPHHRAPRAHFRAAGAGACARLLQRRPRRRQAGPAELLRVLVRALRAGASGADGAGGGRPADLGHRLQGHRGRRRRLSCSATATRTSASRGTPRAGWRSISGCPACPNPSWSMAAAWCAGTGPTACPPT